MGNYIRMDLGEIELELNSTYWKQG